MSDPSQLEWPAQRPAYTTLDAAVQGETARWNAVGLAAGVVRDGERRISLAGFANLPAGYPMREDCLFVTGSISKVYTATLVMRLMERGLLDLDAPIVRYVPDLKLSSDEVRDAITLRMLLSHTAGFEGDRVTAYGRGDDAYQRALEEFHTLTQYFRPGVCYSYSNAGFFLVGHIIQKVTGRSFDAVLTDEILAPLELENTFVDADRAISRTVAAGHAVDRANGVSLFMPRHPPHHTVPAAGIMQSIGELLTFGEMHLNHGELRGRAIISRESAAMMQEAMVESDGDHRHYGLGMSIHADASVRLVGHAGAWSGYRGNLLIVPGKGLVHASLGNSNVCHFALWSLEEWVLEHELGVRKQRPEAVHLSSAELDRHVGIYRSHFIRFEVTRSGPGLRVVSNEIDEATGRDKGVQRRLELEPLRPGRFRVTSLDSRDSTVDFFWLPDTAGQPRERMRVWGRVADRSD